MSVSADTLKRLAALKLPGEAFQEVLSIMAELQDADDARRAAEAARTRLYRKRGGGAIPDDLRKKVFVRDGYACVYCGSQENLQCDHVEPVSKGGPTTLENLATACRTCNAKKRDRDRKFLGRSKEIPRTSVESAPPHPLKKESKNPEEPSGSSGNYPTQAELERELFRRGRQVCGKSSGGLISSLLKAKQFDVALARSVIEMAATKHDPREFVGAIIRNNGHGIQSDRAGGRQPSAITAAIDGHIERFERAISDGGEVREAPARLLSHGGRERS